jgi:hypothetical protein
MGPAYWEWLPDNRAARESKYEVAGAEYRAMTMTRTDRGRYRAFVKEYGDGQPFLALESMGDEIPMLRNRHVSLDLKRGTTLDEARELATLIDKRVEGLAILTFIEDE